MEKKQRRFTIDMPEEIHTLMRQATELDLYSRTMTHFIINAIIDRAKRVIAENAENEGEGNEQ